MVQPVSVDVQNMAFKEGHAQHLQELPFVCHRSWQVISTALGGRRWW